MKIIDKDIFVTRGDNFYFTLDFSRNRHFKDDFTPENFVFRMFLKLKEKIEIIGYITTGHQVRFYIDNDMTDVSPGRYTYEIKMLDKRNIDTPILTTLINGAQFTIEHSLGTIGLDTEGDYE